MADKQGKIVVMGSFIADIAVMVPKFPKEGETLHGSSMLIGPGGKGSNQATAAKRAGADVVMITKLGDDFMRSIAVSHYERENMTQKYVYTQKGGQTGTAVVEINESTAENRIIVLTAANKAITKEDVRNAEEEFKTCDVVLVQLETSDAPLSEAVMLARKHGKISVLNPAPAGPVCDEVFRNTDYFIPNETEAEYYTKIRVTDEESAERAADILLAKGVKNVLITLGKAGVYAKTKDFKGIVPGFTVKAVDTTGAGDAFCGGFCTALAEGKPLKEAVRFANALAAISVTRHGTSQAMPYRTEIDALLERGHI